MRVSGRLSHCLGACVLLACFALAAQAQDEGSAAPHAPAAARSDERAPPSAPRALPREFDDRTYPRAARPHAEFQGDRRHDQADRPQGRAAGGRRLCRLSARWRAAAAPPGDVRFQRRAGRGLASGCIWAPSGRGGCRSGMASITASGAPTLVDNDDTWLDFTDLVFIDPPGTGYSRIVAGNDEARKKLWSVSGDIEALSVVVRRWLAANERLASPKFIVGESYGGFRGPRLAKALATDEGRRRQRAGADFAGAGLRHPERLRRDRFLRRSCCRPMRPRRGRRAAR